MEFMRENMRLIREVALPGRNERGRASTEPNTPTGWGVLVVAHGGPQTRGYQNRTREVFTSLNSALPFLYFRGATKSWEGGRLEHV